MIPCFKLHNGVEVPAIGLGTYRIPNDEEAVRCVRDAVAAGYRSIDTAMFYHNEEWLGKGVRECGMPREEMYVTTKLWNDSHGYEPALKAFAASLRRLGLTYVDEYLIHWPGFDVEAFVQTWKAFETLYKDGLVRVIGVSNFMDWQLKVLMDRCEIKPMVNQIETHPLFQPAQAIRFCRENGIQVEAWRPIAHGKLDRGALLDAAKKYGKTPAQITMRWHYQNGCRAIPKTTHKERMAENVDIFDFSLTEREMERITNLNTYVRTGESPDEFFLTVKRSSV